MTKRKNAPFIAFYPSDWISGVRLLPTVERALYHEICLAIWDTGVGVEPCDLRMLLPETPERLKQAIATLLRLDKIVEVDGRYVNERALAEFAKATKRREDGRKAVAARKDRATPEGTTVPTTVATPVPTPVVTNQNQNQNHIQNQRDKECVSAPARVAKALPSDHPDSAFLNMAPFEAVYPKRSGSQRRMDAAAEATARMKEGYAWEDMIAGAERYRTYCEAAGIIGTQYVMEAMTFLGRNLEFLNPWDPPAKPLTARQRRDRASNDAVRRRLIKTAEETGYGTDRADDIRGNHHVGDAVRQRLANG